jgi:Icc-related predicted phosphoesterase
MKKIKEKKIRFLILGDLHGNFPKINVDLEKIDAIICPGDICGDYIRPYIKKYIEVKSKNLNKKIDFHEICPKWKTYYLEKKSLLMGRRLLKYLNSLGKKVFLVPGNWDQTPYIDGFGSNVGKIDLSIDLNNKKNPWKKIKKGLNNIIDVEYKKVNFNGIEIIGFGSTSAPEILEKPKKKNYVSEEIYNRDLIRYKFFNKKFKLLRRLFLNCKKPVIYISHNAPYKTKLDKVNAPNTYAHNKHYGSIISRKLIDDYQPILNISAHIHEGYGKTRLKKTICINAGFGGEVNTLVEIDLNKNKISNVEFLGKNMEN